MLALAIWNLPTLENSVWSMKLLLIGPQIASEIYDSMEGAAYDLTHRPESDNGPFADAVVTLREKLAIVKPRIPIELTESEVGRLAHELDYASERVQEWNPSLAGRMIKLLEQL